MESRKSESKLSLDQNPTGQQETNRNRTLKNWIIRGHSVSIVRLDIRLVLPLFDQS